MQNKQQNCKNADGESRQVEQIVSGDNDGKLSSKQIVYWRRVLCGMIGQYALIATDAEVQQMRDNFQEQINRSR